MKKISKFKWIFSSLHWNMTRLLDCTTRLSNITPGVRHWLPWPCFLTVCGALATRIRILIRIRTLQYSLFLAFLSKWRCLKSRLQCECRLLVETRGKRLNFERILWFYFFKVWLFCSNLVNKCWILVYFEISSGWWKVYGLAKLLGFVT